MCIRDRRRVMFATEGKDADTVSAFAEDLTDHGGRPKTQVERVCCDMSPAFVKGVNEHLSEHNTDADNADNADDAVVAVGVVADPAGSGRPAHTGKTGDTPVELHRPQIIFD